MLQHQDRAGGGVAGDRVEGALVQHLQGGGAPGGGEGAGALQVAGGQGDQDRDDSEDKDNDDGNAGDRAGDGQDCVQEAAALGDPLHPATGTVLHCTVLYCTVLYCTVLY